MASNIRFDVICRTCMTEQKDMSNIFRSDSNTNQICTMLTSLAAIQLAEQDGLPRHICQQCLMQVNKSYQFKQQCERSDSLLRQYAEQNAYCLGQNKANHVLDTKDILQEEFTHLANTLAEKGLIEPKVEIFDNIDNDPLAWFPDTLLQSLSEDTVEKLIASIRAKWTCTQVQEDCSDDVNRDDDFYVQDIKHEIDSPPPIHRKRRNFKRGRNAGLKTDDRSIVRKVKKKLKHETTGERTKNSLCSLCGKSFASATVLSKHQMIHTGELPFECSTCGKRFRQLVNMKAHESVHTGIRAYLCTECGMDFRTQSALCVHQRIHTGIKKIECKICGMRMNGHLARHMAQHSKERPYACDSCDKSFAYKEKLKIHKTLHTDERKHICDMCNKGFNRKDYLKQHMRIHTGEKPYICEECGAAFSQSHCLITHKKMHRG